MESQRNKQKTLTNIFVKRLKEENLDTLLLQETKCTKAMAKKTIKKCWRTLNAIAIDAQGFSSGIERAWNQTTVQIDTYWTTRRTITTKFHYIGTEIIGIVTLVYGLHTLQEKM